MRVQVTRADSVQDIMHFLFELPETSCVTCYTLHHQGKKLNEYAELAELPEIAEGSVLTIHQGFIFAFRPLSSSIELTCTSAV
jgi:hypothetical protein